MWTKRSPAGVPLGTSTVTSSDPCTPPSPEHVEHGFSETLPEPRQSEHAIACSSTPKKDCTRLVIWPVPPHVVQVIFDAPLVSPEPPHTEHTMLFLRRIVFVVPRNASSSEISIATSASRPFSSRLLRPPAPPKKVSKISPKPPAL